MVTDRRTTEWRDPESLMCHPLNAQIYGTTPDSKFVESIRKHGVLEDLVIVHPDLILSGHRRRQGAIIVGLPEVPCRVLHGISSTDIPVLLVEHNNQRVKTDSQILAEVEILKPLERKAAESRKRSGGPSGESPEGRTRERIAKQTGASENKVRDLLDVSDAIDAAESVGDKGTADGLRETVDTRGAGAAAEKVRAAKKSDKLEIPKHLHRIFSGLSKWKEVHAHYGKLRSLLVELSRLHPQVGSPRSLQMKPIDDHLVHAFALFTKSEPTKLCPRCKGKQGGCEKCRLRGYLVKG